MPKDCSEAYSLGFRYGINYTVSGEYLINPDNTTSSPFLVYCDYSDPTNREFTSPTLQHTPPDFFMFVA